MVVEGCDHALTSDMGYAMTGSVSAACKMAEYSCENFDTMAEGSSERLSVHVKCACTGPSFGDSGHSCVGGCSLNVVPAGVMSSCTKLAAESSDGCSAVMRKSWGKTVVRLSDPTDYTSVSALVDILMSPPACLRGSLSVT